MHHHYASCAGLQQCTLEHLLIDNNTFAAALHHAQSFRSPPDSMCTLVIYFCRTTDSEMQHTSVKQKPRVKAAADIDVQTLTLTIREAI